MGSIFFLASYKIIRVTFEMTNRLTKLPSIASSVQCGPYFMNTGFVGCSICVFFSNRLCGNWEIIVYIALIRFVSCGLCFLAARE
jgi:hypothetical protein